MTTPRGSIVNIGSVPALIGHPRIAARAAGNGAVQARTASLVTDGGWRTW